MVVVGNQRVAFAWKVNVRLMEDGSTKSSAKTEVQEVKVVAAARGRRAPIAYKECHDVCDHMYNAHHENISVQMALSLPL